MNNKPSGFFRSMMKFSLSFIFAVTGLLALAIGFAFMPIAEEITFLSTHSIETDGDEILRFQIDLKNQGSSSVWIDKSNVNSRLSWLQILELGEDDSLTPLTGTGHQPTSWHELKSNCNFLLNAELAGCGVAVDGKYVVAFTIRDWRGKEKLVFGRVELKENGICSIKRHHPNKTKVPDE